MKNKLQRFIVALLAVVLCMTAFSITAFANCDENNEGDPISGETVTTETTSGDDGTEQTASVEAGTGFSENGNAYTRDLLYDHYTNKQFITVQTRNGETFYIVIDYDKPLDEDGESYETYFLNMVDESDLLAIIDEDDLPDGYGEITATVEPESTPKPTVEPDDTIEPAAEDTASSGNNSAVIGILLVVLLTGGTAVWYFKFRKPRTSVKGNSDLDDYDFDDDEDDEKYEHEELPEAPEATEETEEPESDDE